MSELATANEPKLTEPKGAKFKRIANRRVGQVLESLSKIKQMAASSNYEYSMAEIEAMLGVIEHDVGRVRLVYQLALEREKPKDARTKFNFNSVIQSPVQH